MEVCAAGSWGRMFGWLSCLVLRAMSSFLLPWRRSEILTCVEAFSRCRNENIEKDLSFVIQNHIYNIHVYSFFPAYLSGPYIPGNHLARAIVNQIRRDHAEDSALAKLEVMLSANCLPNAPQAKGKVSEDLPSAPKSYVANVPPSAREPSVQVCLGEREADLAENVISLPIQVKAATSAASRMKIGVK